MDTAKKASKRSNDDGDRRKDDRLVEVLTEWMVQLLLSGMGGEVVEIGKGERIMTD